MSLYAGHSTPTIAEIERQQKLIAEHDMPERVEEIKHLSECKALVKLLAIGDPASPRLAVELCQRIDEAADALTASEKRASEAERTFADLRAGMQKIVADNALLARSAEGADRALKLAVVRWTLAESERDEAVKRAEEAEAGAQTLDSEGMAANDKLGKLATLILDLKVGTPFGQLCKAYARWCLGQIGDDPTEVPIPYQGEGSESHVLATVISERDSARAALGKVVEAVKKVAAELADEADNISPTAGAHPAPWMRKQAKRLRTALISYGE